MFSEADIANLALGKLGETGRIMDLAEDTRSARAIAAVFPLVRDKVQRLHFWNFGMTRASLAADTVAPAWGAESRFPLPADFLRLKTLERGHPWAIEGNALLVLDKGPINILYMRRVTETGLFDPLFVEVFAFALALQTCNEITGSVDLQPKMARGYEMALRDAKLVDAQDEPAAVLEETSWVTSRTRRAIGAAWGG